MFDLFGIGSGDARYQFASAMMRMCAARIEVIGLSDRFTVDLLTTQLKELQRIQATLHKLAEDTRYHLENAVHAERVARGKPIRDADG